MKLQENISKVEGHLQKLEDQQFNHLSFEWEGIRFKAVSEDTSDGSGIIRLKAELGRLYYTIENAAHRTMAIERVYSNNRSIDGAYTVDGNGSIVFRCVTKTDKKFVGKALVLALTKILLQAETHLRTLKSHLKSIELAA